MVDPIGTVPALDLLTQDQLDQLFDSQNGYMSRVDETFNLLDAMDEAEAANANNNNNNNNNNNSNGNNNNKSTDKSTDKSNNSNDKNGGGGDNTSKHKRKHSRSASLITDKKTLILDVDNTLIYVRHFMDEMRVNDEVKLGDKRARVKKLTYRLDLEFTEAGQMSVYDHIITSADEHIPQRSDWFPDEITKVALIHQADPTGCEIELIDEFEDDNENNSDSKAQENENGNGNENNDSNNNNNSSNNDNNNENNNDNNENTDENEKDNKKKLKTIEISFLKNSRELSQLEPMMNRPDHVEVDFMYGGYLVRIRPNLAKFLANCNTMFDVILFTAADGSVYKGLLHQVHELLKQKLSDIKDELQVPDPAKLWSQVYFRDDCDEKFDEHGLPYRHKNLSKLGRDLSTIVMVDDNPLSYRGYEPNAVRVAGFWGQSHPQDNELINTLLPTLKTVSKHKDVRYHLSGLEAPSDNEEESDKDKKDDEPGSDDEIEHQRRHSRKRSSKFLDTLKKALDEDMDDENDNDDLDSLDDSSSGKDLEQAANEHANDPNVDTNGLLPQPKQATRSKKQQMESNNNNKTGDDDIMTEQELENASNFTRGHSDSVRIRNDNEASMASSAAGGVVFYNMDDDNPSQAGRPLQATDGLNHKREDSDVIGQHILQPSSDDLNPLQFIPMQPTATAQKSDTINEIENENDTFDEQSDDNNEKDKRRDSIEMAHTDNNNSKNERDSVSHESQSQSVSKTQEDNRNDNLAVNDNEHKTNHISSDSAALNAKYGFVSVNDNLNNNDNNNSNNNNNDSNTINNDNNNNDEEEEENVNSNEPAYVSGTSIADPINDDNTDNHYPLTDDEDVNTGSSCLCFGLFSKNKKKSKKTRNTPMAQQELR